MNPRSIVLALIVSLSVGACSLGRPFFQATTYIVEPLGEVAPVPRRAESLRIGFVRVAAAYAGTALVYRLDEVRYATDPYHAFVADPGSMLGGRMAVWLDRAGPFSAVVAPGSTLATAFILEANVQDMYGDFRADRPPAAVLSIQFSLIDQAGARPRVVFVRTIDRRMNLPRASSDALVRGYDTALAQILSQLASDLSALTAH